MANPTIYVRTVVVVLRPTAALVMLPLHMLWGRERRLKFTYNVVKLLELPPELVLNTNYYQLWPLASLMANITPASAVSVAERALAGSLRLVLGVALARCLKI